MLRMAASAIALCSLILAAFVALEGCGSDPATIPCESDSQCGDGYQCRKAECWPACGANDSCPQRDIYGNWDPLVCYEGFCYLPADVPDAGTTTDAGDGGKTSAICGEPCTSLPEGWSPMPAFWIGPTKSLPAYAPPELGGFTARPIFTGRADLDAPPAECDVCACGESSGKCTELPSSIDVHAAMCGEEGSSISFGGPTNWDGSCTNVNAIPADQKCPAGSSNLCAQSVAVAPLGAPIEESCTPFVEKLPVAKARTYGVTWKTSAVGYDVPGCNTSATCMPSMNGLPSGFRACIYKHGEHECPANWSGDRRVIYEVSADKPGFIDDRNCTPCACGAPVGSACTAQLLVFEDQACSKVISADPLSSWGVQCTNIFPAGKAIGSKEITPLAYLPGACEVLGGEPIGAAIPDETQSMTFCCPAQDA